MSTVTVERAPAREIAAPEITEGDVFTRAADLLEEFDWTRGREARDESGCPIDALSPAAASFCLWGALRRACYDLSPWVDGGPASFCPAVHSPGAGIFTGLCNDSLRNPTPRINDVSWNDMPGRTKSEVVDHLRQLAAG